jgi:hypothetical protein
MVNFKEETLEDLRRHGKTIGDIRWIGDNSGKRTTDIKEFFNSINFRYDDGFGWTAIRESLVIVGDDWWLERMEYDGSEWWEFKTIPRLSDNVTMVEPKEVY